MIYLERHDARAEHSAVLLPDGGEESFRGVVSLCENGDVLARLDGRTLICMIRMKPRNWR